MALSKISLNSNAQPMYHSHSHKDEAFDFFVSFLKNTIQGNNSYKQLVDPIILDAHLLAQGKKDYYSVNRDNYSVIAFLVEADTNFFKHLDANHLTIDDYSKILNFTNTQRQAILA